MPASDLKTSTVYVVDDDASVRKSLARLLRSNGYRSECLASADEFLEVDLGEEPACLVLDVRLPGLDGLDLQREMAQRDMTTPVIFITGHGDVPMSVEAMKAGAVDFLLKPFEEEALLDAVERGLKRNAKLRQGAKILGELRRRFDRLTEREREVFDLVVTGMLNKQIGAELGIVEKTVKVHRARVMEKMEVSSLAELVKFSEYLRHSGH